MQGPIAQSVALTITGNAFLQGRGIGAFWPKASVFQFCRNVNFAAPKHGIFGNAQTILADDPIEWFSTLKGRCSGLRLHVVGRNDPQLADRMSTGFVGGGSRWLIEAVGQPAASLWEDDWRVWNVDAPDRRIWDVSYHRIADNWTSWLPPSRDMRAVQDDLAAALSAIAAFAKRNDLGFVSSFEAGLAALDTDQPSATAYHQDLGPPDYLSAPASRLLNACQAAWVFGGMGSWNDGAYGENLQVEGDALSDRLFNLLQEGISAAANSTFTELSV